jgi:uncharacterized membrane protein
MLATVAWLGGLSALVFIVLPAMRRTLNTKAFASWLTALNKRLDPIGWMSLGLLTFTGLLQMDSNPNYVGLLNFSNPWAQAICLKHIVFTSMLGISGYVTWSVAPALERAELKRATGRRKSDAPRLIRRLQALIASNLILGVIVLIFTALARIA